MPKAPPEENLAQWYVASADRILDAYRTSADPWLYEFDWPKAEICLERAVQLGAGDDRTLAKLALARGYATLERLNGAQYSDTAAALLRLKARDEFMLASLKSPADAAPHLALARVYVYSLPDPEKAMAEFAAAERCGARARTPRGGAAGRRLPDSGAAGEWRTTGGRPCAMPISRAASTGGFPASMKPTAHLRELDRIHAPAPRKPRPRRWYQWR